MSLSGTQVVIRSRFPRETLGNDCVYAYRETQELDSSSSSVGRSILILDIKAFPFDDIRASGERIAGTVLRTPLVPLNVDRAPAEIYLKLENLQPIGSLKIRGAANLSLQSKTEMLQKGIWSASAGNMAQCAAWMARKLGI